MMSFEKHFFILDTTLMASKHEQIKIHKQSSYFRIRPSFIFVIDLTIIRQIYKQLLFRVRKSNPSLRVMIHFVFIEYLPYSRRQT